MLSSMRDRRGNPNLRVRLVAGLIALLLMGPAIALGVFTLLARLARLVL